MTKTTLEHKNLDLNQRKQKIGKFPKVLHCIVANIVTTTTILDKAATSSIIS